MKSIAIIGAGLAGLVAARELSNIANVAVFEKSRGLGGRMATRRADPFAFDHGAQYFSAKSDAFKQFLAPYEAQGVVSDWQPKLVEISAAGKTNRERKHPSYVANPGMSSLAKALAANIEISTACQIAEVSLHDGIWLLRDQDGERHGPFDWVVTAVPSHQAASLLPSSFAHHNAIARVKIEACFSLMLGFFKPISLGFDGAFAEDEVVGWISVNSSKPERPEPFSVLVQSRNDWAEQNTEVDKLEVQQLMLAHASELTGVDLSVAEHQVIHRWLYAHTQAPAKDDCLIDPDNQLAAIGDWCIGGRVEAAFESATALVSRLRNTL